MPCTLENHVTEQGGQQITEGDGGVLTENIHKQRHIVVELHSAAVLMHHQTLELVYLRVVEVDFGMSGQVERLAVTPRIIPRSSAFLERAAVQYAVAEGEKPSSAFHPNFHMRSAVSVLEYRYSLTRLSLSILDSQT